MCDMGCQLDCRLAAWLMHDHLFNLKRGRIRGTSVEVKHSIESKRFKKSYCFSVLMVGNWNTLKQEVAEANSIYKFTKKYGEYVKMLGEVISISGINS